VDIRPAGADAASKPVYTTNVVLPNGASANVVALGLLAGKGAQAFKLATFVTDRSATNGKARVDVIHASPDAPAVDVLAGGTPVAKNLAFGKGTNKALVLDPGKYDLAVVPTRQTSPIVINLAGTQLNADTIYTVLAIGQLANIKPLVLTTQALPPATGFVRVVHASPDAPAVDIYLDGGANPAIKGLAFGQATDFIQLVAKAYKIDIRPAGAPATDKPVFSTTVRLPANASVNLVALGLLGGRGAQRFTVGAFVTDRSATNGKARVEVIHASPDAPAVDILAGGSPVVRSLAFGKGTVKALNLDAGKYDLAVVPAGKKTPVVINLAGTQLNADTIYTVIAIGKLADIKPLVLTSKAG